MIIGLVGKAKSGKDTTADYLVKEHNFVKVAFADDLKDLCMDMFNLAPHQVSTQEGKATIDPRYNKTPREILQIVGTDWFRSIYPTIWVDRLINKLKVGRKNHNFVVTDARFPNEIKALNDIGAHVVKLVRTNYENTGTFAAHASETALESIPEEQFAMVIRANSGELNKLYEGISKVVLYNYDSLI